MSDPEPFIPIKYSFIKAETAEIGGGGEQSVVST